MKRILALVLLFTVFLLNSTFGAVSAVIENSDNQNNTFTVEDIIELKIVSDNTSSSGIDLAQLKQNFVVISQAQQVYHSIINGQASSKVQWTVSLQAKSAGSFTIPAIAVGKETTTPINVVITSHVKDPEKAQEIFINIESDNQSVYVNSPLKLSVNVYVSTDITVRNLQLNTPESTDFTLYKISEANKQAFNKNKRYQLYQVQYLIFFNNSGNVALPKFNLTGFKLKDNSHSQDILSLYQQQWLPFNRNSNPLTINILNKPSEFGDEKWLSADDLEVKQLWSNSGATINSGDALQRTIIVNAQNTPASSIPALVDPTLSNQKQNSYKMYVDKPEYSDEIRNNKLYSTMVQKITYIPTTNGTLKLPDFQLRWWNNLTKTKIDVPVVGNSYQIIGAGHSAASPVKTITNDDIKSSNPSSSDNNSTSDNSTNSHPANSLTADINPQQAGNLSGSSATYLNLIYILLAIIALMSLVLIAFYRKFKRLSQNLNCTELRISVANRKKYQANLENLVAQLKACAAQGDLQNTYKTLTAIGDEIYPGELNSLSKLQRQLPINSQKSIDELLSSLYSPTNTQVWDNAAFLKIVIPSIELETMSIIADNYTKRNSKANPLPSLYPVD